ncbi:MAG: hypothetical protein NTX72_04470 [Candidatus Uhrbacteria bacterium]|nr:hypothetical protein [Candidatus Uhrbacteria bacterium]
MGESLDTRLVLLKFLENSLHAYEVLDFVRDHHVPKILARLILDIAEVPNTYCPFRAANALGIGLKNKWTKEQGNKRPKPLRASHTEDLDILDYPDLYSEKENCWRNGGPWIAGLMKDGTWERKSATC